MRALVWVGLAILWLIAFGLLVVRTVGHMLRLRPKPALCTKCGDHELKSDREKTLGTCWRCTFAEDLERPRPAKISAIPLYCRWCASRTFHVRRQHILICENKASHHTTEAYQMLAAALPEPGTFPGCICFPGERTLFNGKPDPLCFAQEHRP